MPWTSKLILQPLIFFLQLQLLQEDTRTNVWPLSRIMEVHTPVK